VAIHRIGRTPLGAAYRSQLGVLTPPVGQTKLGFDQSTRLFEGCLSSENVEYVQNISSDISLITQCSLVFAGFVRFCGDDAINFSADDWPLIKTWIEEGGRFWLVTEFEGCLGDPLEVVDFLAALGATITYDGGVFDSYCDAGFMTPGDANIAAGITDHEMAATAELGGSLAEGGTSGGTTVFLSPSGKRMVVVEALGSGFLFVSGDSSLWDTGCGFTNCTILTRLLNYADGDII
jgi:hypothetical protein